MTGRGLARQVRHESICSLSEATLPDFVFRNGAHVKGGVDAQTVGTELDRIRDKHDGIKPQAVVDESEPEDAALHPCFTWDNEVAANEFRKVEARSIVRSVRVIYPESKHSEPAYVHVRKVETASEDEPQGGYYERARTVAAEFNLFDNAWRSAQERLSGASKALEELEALAQRHMSDESAARAEAIAVARSKVVEANDLLATHK